ncbi:tbc1 domain family member 10b [Ceraceosorus bombacis]|uniref:Tbc1 domain family member 10b n=1 Tax=Ceraceosorus bombacis TaxID=401625 RepID=A0A0P1BQ97_9BASI|nr:tbc1 domain family member 10b [Ceraceosorus bombacis]
MDAHTLNAWTRFALQKGGIGSCTALIDNPATEAEDLMFMTGEKIIVLRRLDDDNPESSSGKRRSAFGDADAWFLGYCEGVVGRFKGGHVQFHGKLKKPVLMRRSGVGSIRESTVRPMSKSEAAALHASQVPTGIPRTVGAGGAVSGAIGGSSNVEGGGGARPWDRALNGHLSNASSLDTSGTSESGEDGPNRRDQTFSIYDVYGRDSVAFPNFNFTQMNGKLGSSRNLVGASRSQDSLAPRDGAPTSGGSTPEPTTPVDRRPQAPPDPTAGSAMIPANLRSPSGRRPNAAPVPAGLNLASSLRRKVEATTPISATTPMAAYPPQGPGPLSAGPQTATFDPRRRPSGPMSAGAIPTPRPRMAPQRGDSQDSSASAAKSVQDGSVPPGFKPAGQPGGQQAFAQQPGVPAVGPGPPGAAQGGPQLRMQRPAGFGDTRRRSQSVSNLVLKKNPSNPGPGVHGGMAGLAPGANLAPPGASRSPSPLSAVSANSSDGRSSDARRSPNGPPANLPPFSNPNARNASLGQPPRMPDNGKPVQYDSLGFVIMDTPTRLPREDPEAVEAWQKVLAENNLEAARKSRKIKKMAQAGIPHSMRAKVWLFLANSSHRRRPGLFEQLCRQSQGAKGKKGKETAYEAIEKDLDRCYPDHKMFRGEGSTGRADLEAILKAYVHYNPIIGYTQGMGLIAGFMLLLMPAEDAFWLLCAMLRDVHMEGYYSNNMKQLHVDGIVFGQLLQSMDAPLAQRLMEMEIEPINFTPNWFLPLFSRVLPWHTLLCVWDVFFYEGPSFILRTALAVIRIVRDPLMDKRRVPGHGEGMRLLLHPPRELLTPENVVGCALTVKLKEGDMRKLQRNASKLVRQTVGRGRQSSRPGSPSARSTSAPPSKRGG